MDSTPQQLYARVYDLYVPDWPGELDFYRRLVDASPLRPHGLLEIACGTGRVAVQLAADGLDVTGQDISPEMLAVARRKGAGMANLTWVQGDMRSFDLGRRFGFIISPGHSFQFMVTPDDQLQCLETLRRHLVPGGRLALHLDHQDYRWLAGLLDHSEPQFETGKLLTDPLTGERFRQRYAWSYEPATQAATVRVIWEQVDAQGAVLQAWELPPHRLHCAFRFEMEHLLPRAGFAIDAVYGDFFENPLADDSGQMIWVAHA